MIVCHCNEVNDARIRREISRGARDEIALAAACGVGTDCGGCLPALGRLLDECVACPLRTLVDATPAAALG
ncbi:MAG TPA: (2Fe-2S)-binding protein [Egibacteraceae bacterium]|nr:(2Fe-2S)-binding protein [Egibacteraceae bacterium]